MKRAMVTADGFEKKRVGGAERSGVDLEGRYVYA